MEASARVTQILSRIESGAVDSADLPDRLVHACAHSLPVTGVGLVLMTDMGSAGTVAVTDGPAALMEDLQFTLGEGPCVDSSETGRPVLQPDLGRTAPGRWPLFCAAALDVGIYAIFAFPLRVGGIRLGVLDLYRDRPGALTNDEQTESLCFADAAIAVLLHLQGQPSPNGELGPIPMFEERAEVHQATGIISVQAGVTLSQALVLLRARAFAAGRPITALARDVVAGKTHFGNGGNGQAREP